MKRVSEYVDQWTQYQSLWDLQPEMLYEKLTTDLDSWMQVLVDIKKARGQVDTQESEHEIFPFVVDYTRVQTKVSVKYDYWQREVMAKFGAALGISHLFLTHPNLREFRY